MDSTDRQSRSHYLRPPVFDWNERLGFGSRRTIRRWWRDGIAHAAVAVHTADEEFLITHAGVTEPFWRHRLDSTDSAAESAVRLNATARDEDTALFDGGCILGGGPPNPQVGPIWPTASSNCFRDGAIAQCPSARCMATALPRRLRRREDVL